MLVMNGCGVLELIRTHALPAVVLLVSGDVQEEARQRAISKCALDFIRNTASSAQIMDILTRYGIFHTSLSSASLPPTPQQQSATPPGATALLFDFWNLFAKLSMLLWVRLAAT